jgi:dTMP kinase
VPDELSFLRKLSGKFLVFEGPDGSGKSTQFRRLHNACERAGVTVCEVREPGGTPIGERIRDILLDRVHDEMSLRCEMMLYMASRAQLVEQRIRPALARGQLVLADRFVESTISYQGYAGGMPIHEIEQVAAVATGGFKPDLVLVFDVDEATAARRLSPLLDRMESKGAEFHRKVREGYHAQARAEPGRFDVIDARGTEEQVWNELVNALRARSEKK